VKLNVLLINNKHRAILDDAIEKLTEEIEGRFYPTKTYLKMLSKKLIERNAPHVLLIGMEVSSLEDLPRMIGQYLRPEINWKLGALTPEEIMVIPYPYAEEEIDPPEPEDNKLTLIIGGAIIGLFILLALKRKTM